MLPITKIKNLSVRLRARKFADGRTPPSQPMYKYQLQPYKGMPTRYSCPNCRHRKSFTRYIDTDTGQHIATHVGICNRKDKCGYHYTPKQFFALGIVAAVSKFPFGRAPKRKPKPEVEYFINPEFVESTYTDYGQNNFVQYLIARFGFNEAEKLVGAYRIGTSGHWFGATIFWQIDTHNRVRTGKIMLYDKQTGKRVKQPFNHITWAHALALKTAPADIAYTLNQCFFGEHLLITSPYKPVAIVESEKTAVIAGALMPAFIWISCGSLEGLNLNKCKILQNREVMLFPDVNASKKWHEKAKELRRAMPGTKFVVSDYLEKLATEKDKKDGVDIGDVVFG